MGQSIVHPDSTGVWIAHVLEKGWAAQQDPDYSPAEKLQILAWSYGFAIHAAGDVWSHTLVNEFTDGTFPAFANVITEEESTANAMRHFIVEAYVGDATPGFDGIKEIDCRPDPEPIECSDEASKPHGFVPDEEVERTRLPDGDVSDDSTPSREIDAPHRFVYEVLIKDLPDLPGHKERFLFTITNAGGLYALLDGGGQVPGAILTAFDNQGIVLPSFLSGAPTLEVIELWRDGELFR
jgi:hypothetical protein